MGAVKNKKYTNNDEKNNEHLSTPLKGALLRLSPPARKSPRRAQGSQRAGYVTTTAVNPSEF
jgi:hypothetical protein